MVYKSSLFFPITTSNRNTTRAIHDVCNKLLDAFIEVYIPSTNANIQTKSTPDKYHAVSSPAKQHKGVIVDYNKTNALSEAISLSLHSQENLYRRVNKSLPTNRMRKNNEKKSAATDTSSMRSQQQQSLCSINSRVLAPLSTPRHQLHSKSGDDS